MKNYRLGLMALILIAFAIRLHQLTYHSLWFDEAVSVHWARQSLPRILEVGFTLQEDRLPPLYYLTLKGWGLLAGWSEFAVRLPTVFYGTLLLPALAGVGALLFNRRVALFAVALAAVNPFLVWYAQEARMYAPAVFFGTLAVWAFLKICQSAQPQFAPRTLSFGLVFVLAAVAALYSHLYAGFLLPAVGLWLVAAYPRRRRLWAIFAAGGFLAALAYTPILLAIWRFSAEAQPGEPLAGLPERARWLLAAFTVWKAPLEPWLQTAIPLVVAGFTLPAYLPLAAGQRQVNRPRLLTSLLLLTPFAIANLLLARNHLAFFGERYFIVMTPWLLLLAAAGADRIGSWLRMCFLNVILRPLASESLKTYPASGNFRDSSLPLVAQNDIMRHNQTRFKKHALNRLTIAALPFVPLLLAAALPLPGLWTPAAAKEAWRQSVDYLAQHATPADGILIHPDWVRYPFQFYFTGPGQTYAAFSTVTAATALDGPLQGVVNNHPVIWLIQSHLDAPDPDRRVEQWLAARYPLITELYPPGISLKGFAPRYQLKDLPPAATPVNLQFGNGMRLAGFTADAVASATDTLFHPPSGWAHVTLYWQAAGPVAAAVTPVVNLVGPEGVWGVSLDRPTDALKLFPPARWQPGGPLVRQDLDVNLNPATPPGEYQLVVGLAGSAEQFPLAKVKVR